MLSFVHVFNGMINKCIWATMIICLFSLKFPQKKINFALGHYSTATIRQNVYKNKRQSTRRNITVTNCSLPWFSLSHTLFIVT